MTTNRIIHGDAATELERLPDESVDCIVTSPPYYSLRDYEVEGQIGLEDTAGDYLDRLMIVFAECYRVLKGTGTLWLNMGDSYAGSWGNYAAGGTGQRDVWGERWERAAWKDQKYRPPASRQQEGLRPKNLFGMPWRLAFRLQDFGWFLRDDIIWHKPAPMPESVRDRTVKAHEYLFLLAKARRYHFDQSAIREPVTGGTKPRGKGTGPKSRVKRPAGWDESPGGHHGKNGHYRYPRTRTRSDFQEAIAKEVLTTDKAPRSVWTIAAEGNGAWHFDDHDGPDGKPCTGIIRKVDPKCPIHGTKETTELECTCEEEACAETIAHYATFPRELARRCIAAGCPEDGIVLDPFIGSGTVAIVAAQMRRKFIGIELNPKMVRVAEHRLNDMPLLEAMTT